MRKRVILASVFILMILLPVFSVPNTRSYWSTGFNLGSGVQSVTQYRINEDLDIMAGVGFDFFYSNALNADLIANYRVSSFAIGEETFDVTVGGGALVGLYNQLVELSLVIPAGVTYHLADEIFPLDIYVRVGPTIRILKGYQTNLLGIYSFVGVLYRF